MVMFQSLRLNVMNTKYDSSTGPTPKMALAWLLGASATNIDVQTLGI